MGISPGVRETKERTLIDGAVRGVNLPVYVVVLCVLTGGIVTIGAGYIPKSVSEPVIGAVSSEVVTYSTDTPDESEENARNYPWSGGLNEPKRIIIEQSNVNALIQRSGVDQNGAVAVPNNVHLAGWFVDSAAPGRSGLSIVSGHVSGRTTGGVFKSLSTLKVGDVFGVELGSGGKLRYEVFEVRELPEEETAAYLFSQDPGVESQLNLVTCAGQFDEALQRFSNRVVVYSKLIES